MSSTMSAPPAPEAIFAWIRSIPPGCVTTYGDLVPGAPRQAGRLLSQGPPGLPWWRVVRADGSLAKGSDQRRRLAAEGVPMRGARVDMRAARLPREALIDLARSDHAALGDLGRPDADALGDLGRPDADALSDPGRVDGDAADAAMDRDPG
jgi:alkylated DNA nucleotide flippase Atl1